MALPLSNAPHLGTIQAARNHLAAADPALAAIDRSISELPWRASDAGFSSFLKIIAGQQVSVASAAALWRRVDAGLGAPTPAKVLAAEIDGLRGLGFSLPKARYAHGLAVAVIDGRLDLAAIAILDDEEAIEALTAHKGIGRWTAEIYLMFALGRLDVFPAGDIALREAMASADGASGRGDEASARARALIWRPYRAVAAHLLWRHYANDRALRAADRAPKNAPRHGDVVNFPL